METTLDQLRRLFSQPDSPDLRSWSGAGRSYRTLFVGCTQKVSLGRPAKRSSATVRLLTTINRIPDVEIRHCSAPIVPAADRGRLAS